MLVPFVAADILHGQWTRALILFFAAGLTDVIDGFLARRFGQPTRVGAYFDPIADKILLVAIYIALGAAQAIPRWMVALVFGRDFLILGMAAYGLLFTSVRKFPPSVWGKISTFFQIAAALVSNGRPRRHPSASPAGPRAHGRGHGLEWDSLRLDRHYRTKTKTH